MLTPEQRERVAQDRIRKLARDLYMARQLAQPDCEPRLWTELTPDQKSIRFAEMQTLVRGEKP